ncbi:MAG: SGNH/GDSL hydrolase family protein, partial [Oscillospiraceae bacterium]|nr:SGNH/GDSL hydrolase family protein [Oscillospiraceae bacterium]
ETPVSIIPGDNSTVGAWYNNGSTFVTDEGVANYIEVVEDGCKDAGSLHVYQDNVANNDMSLGMFLGGQAAGTYTVKFHIKGDVGYQNQPFKIYPYGTEPLVSNVSTILGTTEVADWTEISYDVAVPSDFFYLIFWFSKYNWATDAYIDNIQVINSSGVDVLSGAGNFYTTKTVTTSSAVTGQYPVMLDTTKIGNGWGSAPGDEWVPFAPTGEFDPAYGFNAWTDTYYCEVVADGYKDAGSLHMVISQNTAVVINAGMVSGEQYTIGMWVKGTATSNRVLGLYGNGDPAIIGNPEYCGEVAASTVPAEWTYLEKTFTANTNSIVLHGNGWGPADIYIDNITLKNSSCQDLISGYGDFSIHTESGEEEKDVSGTNIYGKSVLFTGDSISWGSDQRAWAARIGEKYEMDYINASVSGASVSTTRIYRMIDQIEANKTGSFDYVIMHGPTNDAWDEIAVGALSESFNVADYDVSTYAGALEELFYYARQYFPNAKPGYIINFRFSSSLDNGLSDMSAYVEMAKEVCNKWSVPYLDLYNNEELTAALKVGTTVYLPDNVHPNAAGYDILTPYIADWMNETVATQEPPVEPEEPEVT